MTTFGERIKSLRVEGKGMSIAEAAKELGIPKSTLNNYERDIARPSLEMICKMADYYNTTLDYLADYQPDKEAAEIANAIRKLSPDQKKNIMGIVESLGKK